MNLFDEAEVNRCGSADVLRHRALLAFGCLKKTGGPAPGFRQALSESLRKSWDNLAAAEVLLAKRAGTPLAFTPPSHSRPCGLASPAFRGLSGLPFGVALFPLASAVSNPELGCVWCFSLAGRRKGLPQPAIPLDGWTAFRSALPNRDLLRFYFDIPRAAVIGKSWQLAAHLAAAFSARQLGPQVGQLVGKWIATGAVDADGTVHPVDAGNKCRLDAGDRRWLFPANTPDFRDVAGHSVSSLEEARAHILNTPIPLPQDRWPARIRVLHMLVGGNTAAQEAAGLIPDAVERIVLWHSKNRAHSVDPAMKLASCFRKLRPKPQVERRLLSANSLVAMQETIATRLLPDLEQATEAEPVWFNVTSGNRLMFFAVFMLARQPRFYRKLSMIYRERDTPGLSYIQIRYTDAGPETREIRLPPDFSPGKRESVNKLLNPPEKEKDKCFMRRKVCRSNSGKEQQKA